MTKSDIGSDSIFASIGEISRRLEAGALSSEALVTATLERIAQQNPALNAWKGQNANIGAAQRAFHHRAQMNGLAAQGKWKAELEKQAA